MLYICASLSVLGNVVYISGYQRRMEVCVILFVLGIVVFILRYQRRMEVCALYMYSLSDLVNICAYFGEPVKDRDLHFMSMLVLVFL